jgi:SAM-dependent methyltransferase
MQRLLQPAPLLYTLTARHYERAIGPVMRPLARSLIRAAELPAAGTLLDLGTGTAFAIRYAASPSRHWIGLDTSLPMLREADILRQQRRWPRVHLVQADIENPACASHAADLVLSSFGLSDGDPGRVLKACWRLLKPGGRLVLQEWGPYDSPNDPRLIVDQILGAYAAESSDGTLAALREIAASARPWDMRMQDADDYAEALACAGFERIAVKETRPVMLRLPARDFLSYALAWAPRAAELAAMESHRRTACMPALRQAITARVGRDGLLHWAPRVIRAEAHAAQRQHS